jgi:hypothetical protein
MSDDARDNLLEELEHDGAEYFNGGYWNNISDIALTTVIVLTSLVSAVLAVVPGTPRWLVAIIAATPAAAASFQRTVGTRDRSNWYFVFAAHVRAVETELRVRWQQYRGNCKKAGKT